MTLHHGAQCAQQSHRLRRIVFTTYALVLNHSYTLPHYSTQSALWEAKLGRANTFVPALYVGEADSPPIYAVHTLAEVALKPRHVHRVAEHLRLAYESMRDDSAVLDLSRLVMPKTEVGGFWPKSLIGLYYLSPDSPQINPIWSPPSCPPHHLFQLTDQSHRSKGPPKRDAAATAEWFIVRTESFKHSEHCDLLPHVFQVPYYKREAEEEEKAHLVPHRVSVPSVPVRRSDLKCFVDRLIHSPCCNEEEEEEEEGVTNIQTTGFPKEVKTVLWTFSTVIVLIITVAVIFALRMRNRVRRYLHYQLRTFILHCLSPLPWLFTGSRCFPLDVLECSKGPSKRRRVLVGLSVLRCLTVMLETKGVNECIHHLISPPLPPPPAPKCMQPRFALEFLSSGFVVIETVTMGRGNTVQWDMKGDRTPTSTS
ncbi:serine/threonine protein kinase [Echinococcus granulosus]|uniref:Serine/threonine protein kinase n=1 Tax=Echinococcus granulosus TaxID=6210 RepID=W6UFU2_ECHGR|nr:serine/threonine protein kinase [Echinococcus granulosus]EUB60330.1 serine/threonine protein kinase [Echinococcus granulosus]